MFGVESTAPTLRLQLPAAVLILVGVFWPAVELSVEWPGFSPVTASYSWIDVPGAGGFTALLSVIAALGAILRLGRSPDTLWLVMIGWALTVILTLCVLAWFATLMYAEPRVAQAIADAHGGGGDGRSAHWGACVFARIRRGQKAACGQHRHRTRRSDPPFGGAGPALARLPSSEGTCRAGSPCPPMNFNLRSIRATASFERSTAAATLRCVPHERTASPPSPPLSAPEGGLRYRLRR